MSYKLADGSDSSQYKVGDLFERPNGRLAEFSLDDGTSCPYFKLEGSEEVVSLFWDCLKPRPKPFTKDDLKDGMRVDLRNGSVRFLLGNNLLSFDRNAFMGNGGFEQATYKRNYKDVLEHYQYSELDIIKVTDRDGTIVFQREPELIEKTIKATGEQWEKINEILESN